MENRRTYNGELARDLGRYHKIPLIISGITGALCVPPGETATAEKYPVLGYYLVPGDPVFAAYILTPGRFIIHEVVPSGESLTITVPLRRVRRVVEASKPGSLSITIEIDADKVVTRMESESLERPADDDESSTNRYARSQAILTSSNTVYDIKVEWDAEAEPDGTDASDVLREFSYALRGALEY